MNEHRICDFIEADDHIVMSRIIWTSDVNQEILVDLNVSDLGYKNIDGD